MTFRKGSRELVCEGSILIYLSLAKAFWVMLSEIHLFACLFPLTLLLPVCFSLEVVQRKLILTSQPLGWMCATGFIPRKQTLPLAVRTTDPVSSLAPGILVDR